MTPLELLEAHGVGDIAGPLQRHLARRRWFGGQGRVIESVSIADAAVLGGPDPVMLFLITRVRYGDGGEEHYATPLSLRRADRGAATVAEHPIAHAQTAGGHVVVRDALTDPECIALLWRVAGTPATVPTCAGSLEFLPRGTAGSFALAQDVRVLGGEQSNTAMVWGDREFMKYLRRVEPGPSIELEMSEVLEKAGFSHTPRVLGSIVYRTPASEVASPVAIIQSYQDGGTDGWTLALRSLEMLHTGEVADFTPDAAGLGRVTADMHLALGSDSPGGGVGRTRPVAPRVATASDLESWAGEMTAQLDRLLARGDPVLEPLGEHRQRLVATFDAIQSPAERGMAIRVHGDLHLGQVIRIPDDWMVIDFEGEPSRSPAERRRCYSPLRDVAGMLRSFDYAAAAAATALAPIGDPRWHDRYQIGLAWARACRQSFWRSYSDRVEGAGLIPGGAGARVIRRAFELDKAVYEAGYELGHRPEWAAIPLQFLLGAEPEP